MATILFILLPEFFNQWRTQKKFIREGGVMICLYRHLVTDCIKTVVTCNENQSILFATVLVKSRRVLINRGCNIPTLFPWQIRHCLLHSSEFFDTIPTGTEWYVPRTPSIFHSHKQTYDDKHTHRRPCCCSIPYFLLLFRLKQFLQ